MAAKGQPIITAEDVAKCDAEATARAAKAFPEAEDPKPKKASKPK